MENNEPKIFVLRLNHRPDRDKRATTHLFLAARALGADKVLYSGRRDEKIEESIRKVNQSWGEGLKVEHVQSWRKTTEIWKEEGKEIIHLTMYGLPLQSVIEQIRKSGKDKLIVVGGAKVPGTVYQMANWNVSVTSQPHSEISALGIFLHELHQGRELGLTFKKARMQIIPQAKGKKVSNVET